MPDQHKEELNRPEKWFEAHIIGALDDLKNGQAALDLRIEKFSQSLRAHEDSDVERFNKLGEKINNFAPAAKIVFGGVGLLLTAVALALITLVLKGR